MKRLITTLVPLVLAAALMLALGGCVTVNFRGREAKNTLTGSGELVEISFDVESYSKVDIDVNAKIIFTNDASGTVKVKMQQNLLDDFSVSVKNNLLVLDSTRDFVFDSSKTPVIYLSVPGLTHLYSRGKIQLSCEEVFTADEISFDLRGETDGNLTVDSKNLNVNLSGSGNIMLVGIVDNTQLLLRGLGSIDASDMVARSTSVEISGSGKVITNTTDTLSVRISGQGEVRYLGSPRIDQTISGAGQIAEL